MKILKCEGFIMFDGSAIVTPKTDKVKPFILTGTWLYRPDNEAWYCQGRSFSKEIVSIIEEG
jgi:hypothetical protein